MCWGLGLLRDSQANWISGFAHHEVGGYVLFDELRVISIGFNTCYNMGYDHVIGESGYLEVVNLCNKNVNNFHWYASLLLQIAEVRNNLGNETLGEEQMC